MRWSSDGSHVSTVPVHGVGFKVGHGTAALFGIGKLVCRTGLVVVFVVRQGRKADRVLGLAAAVAGTAVAVGAGADLR